MSLQASARRTLIRKICPSSLACYVTEKKNGAKVGREKDTSERNHPLFTLALLILGWQLPNRLLPRRTSPQKSNASRYKKDR